MVSVGPSPVVNSFKTTIGLLGLQLRSLLSRSLYKEEESLSVQTTKRSLNDVSVFDFQF